jgi:hypothetical protein
VITDLEGAENIQGSLLNECSIVSLIDHNFESESVEIEFVLPLL